MTKHIPEGLTDKEVVHSRSRYGSNELKKESAYGFFHQFIANFGDPIIKILLVVLLINIVFLFRHQHWYETIGIAVAILLATLVSTLSEYGSESAFAKLQEEASRVYSVVRRNGKTVEIPIGDIVVGDIVLLSAGDPIPADGKLIKGALTVDQSALNGESHEVEKNTYSQTEGEPFLNTNLLFRGSVVCSGKGELQVTQVGEKTYYGNLSREVQDKTRESPLKFRLADLSQKLSKFGFFAGGCVAVSDLFHTLIMESNYHWPSVVSILTSPPQLFAHLFHALLLALSVVVVAVPEGLPMMITVVLSSNMRRMLKDHVLVRKLVGIETSGSLNLLFTDKTGTLTKGTPTVSLFIDGFGKTYRHREEFDRTVLWETLALCGYYNTESVISGKDILKGNATERAILSYVHGRRPFNTGCSVVRQTTFTSDQKWSATEIRGSFFMPKEFCGNSLTLIKGAPDKLLPCCSAFLDKEGRIQTLTASSKLYQIQREYEQKSMRLIALAISPAPLVDFPQEMILLGLLALVDEIRSDVPHAVKTMHQAGIQVVMMTGDSAETATSIAKKVGLLTNDDTQNAVLTSKEIAKMSDRELADRLPSLRVIARALPQDKSRLVGIAQNKGLVVGMTGDGINDAPALKKADIGFAMGSGTEVAKQAGDIVILNNSFSSICKAVQYGRTIFKSIRKFIVFQLTMNLCAVAVSVIGPLVGVDMPVTVMQMLWINIIMDTLAGLAFAGEAPLEEYMNEAPKKRNEPILNRYMLHQILFTGGFTVLLLTLFLKLNFLKDWFRYSQSPLYWMTAFFALFIFCGIFNSFNARTTRLNLLAYLSKNRLFLLIIGLIAVVQVALIYYGGSLFRTDYLTFAELMRVLLLSTLVIPFDILRKIILRVFHRKGAL